MPSDFMRNLRRLEPSQPVQPPCGIGLVNSNVGAGVARHVNPPATSSVALSSHRSSPLTTQSQSAPHTGAGHGSVSVPPRFAPTYGTSASFPQTGMYGGHIERGGCSAAGSHAVAARSVAARDSLPGPLVLKAVDEASAAICDRVCSAPASSSFDTSSADVVVAHLAAMHEGLRRLQQLERDECATLLALRADLCWRDRPCQTSGGGFTSGACVSDRSGSPEDAAFCRR